MLLQQSSSCSWTHLNSLINLPQRPLNMKTNCFLIAVREHTSRIAPLLFCWCSILLISFLPALLHFSALPGWNRLMIIFFPDHYSIQNEQKYPQSMQVFSWHNTFEGMAILCLLTSPGVLWARERLCDLLRPPFNLLFCLFLPMGKAAATSLSLTNAIISHPFACA